MCVKMEKRTLYETVFIDVTLIGFESCFFKDIRRGLLKFHLLLFLFRLPINWEIVPHLRVS